MREDIQCLRGIAIILVFSFHMSSVLFPNGFLGVDMFFVISGFLMAKTLSNLNLKSPKNIVTFYYKRFRRILPLYYLIVFLIVVMVHLYLGDFLWENNNRYSLASLFLITNQLVIHDQADYFNEFRASTSSVNLFLHLWSLSVEMQFYSFVPFIFLGLQFLKRNSIKLIAVSTITILGFVAFSLVHEKFAFNFMLLRLWQFSAGFMAFFIKKADVDNLPEKMENGKNKKCFANPIAKEDLVTIALILLTCCFLPNKLNVKYLRPLVTSATAVLIASKTKGVWILESKVLAYIGHISYVLYLVHWPIIAVFLGSTVSTYMFCILCTLLSSILLHHLYEKRYLKMNWRVLVPFICALVLCNSYLQNSVREHSFWNTTFSEELQEIVDRNKAMLPYSWINDPMARECIEDKRTDSMEHGSSFGYGSCQRGNGTQSVMVIGNSYVMSFRDPIRYYFNNNFSEFRYSSLGEGFALYADSIASRTAMDIFRKQVEQYRPDILFVIARHSLFSRAPFKDNDDILTQINETISFYEQFTKKILILDPHPLYKLNFMNYFLQYTVNRPEEVEYLHLNKREADHEMRHVKKRFSMVQCTKCEFFDLSHVFVDNEKYLTFDRDQMVSYVDNTIHLTSAGIDLCRPVLKELVEKTMNRI